LSKIILTKKINAIFLAIVLVAGVFAISSPLTVYGQQYQQEDYEFSSYYPSDPRMDYDSQSVKPSQKANCDNKNVNNNGIEQKQSQRQAIDSTLGGSADDGITGQELTSEEGLDAITGNGDGGSQSLLNIERNIVNICINSNDNTLTGTFTSTQTQTVDECAEDVEACFKQNLAEGNFELLSNALNSPAGITAEINGVDVTLKSFADICSALEGLTFAQLTEAISNILFEVNIILITSGLAFCLAEVLGIPVPPR
jgi:hypothetical protein